MTRRLNIIGLLLFFSLLTIQGTMANELTQKDITSVKTQRYGEHFIYEPFLGNNDGLKGLLAWEIDAYISPGVFLCAYTSWAILGNRGGFGIAGVGIGLTHHIIPGVDWDSRIITGAGGGKYLSTGGGFLLQAKTGFRIAITRDAFIDLNYGYTTFPKGSYECPLYNIGISYFYDKYCL